MSKQIWAGRLAGVMVLFAAAAGIFVAPVHADPGCLGGEVWPCSPGDPEIDVPGDSNFDEPNTPVATWYTPPPEYHEPPRLCAAPAIMC